MPYEITYGILIEESKFWKKGDGAVKKILSVILSVCLLAAVLPGCGVVQDHEDMKVIGVISKGDDTAFWRAVLAGAEDAAIENGYAMTFRGTEHMGQEGMSEQQRIMQLALDNGAVGIVVAAVGEGFVEQLAEADRRNIPVIQFDSGVWPSDLATLKREKCNPVVASVYTKNREAAYLSAEHLFDHVWWDISAVKDPYRDPYVVGVIQHDLSPSGRDRTEGFVERFTELAEMNPETRGKYKILLQVRSSSARNNYAKALGHLYEEGVDAVFMTSGDVVEQVSEEISKTGSRYENVVFTGFDAGDRQLNWMRSMEMPVLIGSVTQDAYQLGYNAVLQCVNGMEARGVTAFVEIPGIWYNRFNLEDLMEQNLIEEG